MIRRPPRSTQSRSSAASDVYKRQLWDHQASDTDSRLILDIPDFSLVQSLRACPTSFSTKVTEWLHETVRMFLSSSTSLIHTSPTPFLKGSYTSGDLGMHLAHASVQTGLSPLSSIPPELVHEHGLVTGWKTRAGVTLCRRLPRSLSPPLRGSPTSTVQALAAPAG